jgi:hypothetical protein
MTKDQQIAYAVAYNHGYENGQADRRLNYRSEYVWASVTLSPKDSYTYAYGAGYRKGWHSRVTADTLEGGRLKCKL